MDALALGDDLARGLGSHPLATRIGTGLWASVDAENIAQCQLCYTEDYYEGFVAFNEKRKPQFKGA